MQRLQERLDLIGLGWYCKDFLFYSKGDGKSSEGFKQNTIITQLDLCFKSIILVAMK